MNQWSSKAAEELARLHEAAAEDMASMPVEELEEELKAAGEDVDELAARFDAILQGAIAEAGRRRLQAARVAVNAQREKGAMADVPVLRLPLARKQEILRNLARREDGARITMANRNGEREDQLSEHDIDGVLRDAFELGLVDDAGEPR